ncbi:MAG: helix-turn-helix transcriptional regulator [Romboutsia sp.]
MDLSIIKRIRKEKNLSQQDLGDKLGVSGAYIQQIENNKKNPSMKTLQRISDALGVPTFILTGGEEVINSNNFSYDNIGSFSPRLNITKLTSDNIKHINYYIEKDKIDFAISSLNNLGYQVSTDYDASVSIIDNSSVMRPFEIDMGTFLDFSKNLHWALDSFVSKFIDEHSKGFIDEEEDEEYLKKSDLLKEIDINECIESDKPKSSEKNSIQYAFEHLSKSGLLKKIEVNECIQIDTPKSPEKNSIEHVIKK